MSRSMSAGRPATGVPRPPGEHARSDARVAVVDDHELFASALTVALSARGFEATSVVPEPGGQTSVAALVREITRVRPDIVLLDLELGNGRDGMELVAPLSALGIDVLVVSNGLDGARAGEALSLGARRAVSKSTPLSEVARTIERLARGLPVLTHGEAGRLLLAWTAQSATYRDLRARLDGLTYTEADILGHLMQGQQVGEIARIRVVSESTVRTHVKAILAKLQVKSQLTAVGLAYRLGWQPPSDTTEHPATPARHPGPLQRSGRAS